MKFEEQKYNKKDESNNKEKMVSQGLYRLFWINRAGYNDREIEHFFAEKETKSRIPNKENNNEEIGIYNLLSIMTHHHHPLIIMIIIIPEKEIWR